MQTILMNFAVILFFGLCAQWIAWRYKVPALLFFLLFGLGLGPVFGVVHTAAIPAAVLEPGVALGVAVILFEGSLNLNFRDLQQSGKAIGRLLTVGFLLAWLGIALGGVLWLGLNWKMSALLGAILAVTGPTAVLPVLKHLRVEKSLASILRWEALAIDPLGALFAILLFQAIATSSFNQAAWVFIFGLLKTCLLGAGLGMAAALGLAWMMRRFLMAYPLQGAATLTVLVTVFAVAVRLQGEATGFFAATVMGIVLANQKQAAINHIVEFEENLAILLVPALFITLASRVTWRELQVLNWNSAWFILWIIMVVRPASVWMATAGLSLSKQARLFIAGMAPRGIVAAAVAGVFALRLQEQHIGQAGVFLPVALLVVIATVLCYSLIAVPFSRLLGVALTDSRGVLIFGIHPFSLQLALQLKKEGIWCVLVDVQADKVREAKNTGLNARCHDIYDEKLFEPADMSRVGYFLAMTSNDEANSLATVHCKKHFEQAHIYQLPPKRLERPEAGGAGGLHGRYLFQSRAAWDYLDQMMSRGGRVYAQPAGDAPGPAVPGSAEEEPLPLFTIKPGRELAFVTLDSPLNTSANGKVYYLMPGSPVPSNRLAAYLAGQWQAWSRKIAWLPYKTKIPPKS